MVAGQHRMEALKRLCEQKKSIADGDGGRYRLTEEDCWWFVSIYDRGSSLSSVTIFMLSASGRLSTAGLLSLCRNDKLEAMPDSDVQRLRRCLKTAFEADSASPWVPRHVEDDLLLLPKNSSFRSLVYTPTLREPLLGILQFKAWRDSFKNKDAAPLEKNVLKEVCFEKIDVIHN